MATYSATRAKHATLTTTAVDTVTIGSSSSQYRFGAIEVVNRDAANPIYFTFSETGATPTVPTAAGDNTFFVPASGSKAMNVDLAYTNLVSVSLIGSGNAYSVHGLPRTTSTPR